MRTLLDTLTSTHHLRGCTSPHLAPLQMLLKHLGHYLRLAVAYRSKIHT